MRTTDPTSLYDMLQEMMTWVPISPEDLNKARSSDINTTNSPQLKRLVRDWVNGIYDEDPEILVQELQNLIP